jgi:hypothetical protein
MSSPRSPVARRRRISSKHAVELGPRLLHPRVRRPRPAQDLEEVVARVERQRLLEQGRGIDATGRPVGVQAEQGAHGDAHRQPSGPRVQVHARPLAPAGERAVDLGLHHLDRPGHPIVVKGGEHDPARAAVKVAVDREQAVTQERDQVPHVPLAPGEVPGMGDGHVVVGLRAEHEHRVGVEDAQREHGPVALVGLEQQGEGIEREALRAPEVGPGLAGRKRHVDRTLGQQVAGQVALRIGAQGGRAGERRHARREA